jgi:hypothetical protein
MSEVRDIGPLRAALEAANRRAAAAEGASQELRSRLQNETGARLASQEAALDLALAQTEETSAALERDWARLQADGKFEEAAAVTRKMADQSARASRFREQKQEVAQARSAPAPQPPEDPLGAYSPAVRAWIGANPQFLTDGEFKDRAMRGHHAALAQGIPPDTEKYFEQVERHVHPERFNQDGSGNAGGSGNGSAADTSAPGSGSTIPVNPSTVTTPVATDASPLSQPAEQDIEVVVDNTPPDRSTRSLPPQTASRQEADIPVEIDQAPQHRAVGRPGGAGIASVAAPPSRNIAIAAARATGGGPISISPEEMEVAMSLAETIEPEVARSGRVEVAKWYAAQYGSPSVSRKIAKWDAR